MLMSETSCRRERVKKRNKYSCFRDGSDKVCVKIQKSQKNYKNNEVITITSMCVVPRYIGLRRECQETVMGREF